MAIRKFVYLHPVEGFLTDQSPDDTLSIGHLDVIGTGSGIGINVNGQSIIGLPPPVNPTDATNKAYVDSVVQNISWKQYVRLATSAPLPSNVYNNAVLGVGATLTATSNGALSVDGITVALNDRILVKDEAISSHNSIYTVTQTGNGSNPYILTRALDNNIGSELVGNAVYTDEGSTNTGDTYNQITAAPITVGVSPLVWLLTSSTSPITASLGLIRIANDIEVKPGDGIDNTSNGQSTNVKLANNPGLQFVGAPGSGALSTKIDPASSLYKNGNGLGVTTDRTLTQNSQTLVVYSAPKIDALYTASSSVSAGQAVYWSVNDKIAPSNNTNDAIAHTIGMAPLAILASSNGIVITEGIVEGVLSGATVNTPYYLGPTGLPVLYSTLSPGARIIQLGKAKNANDLFVQIKDFGRLS